MFKANLTLTDPQYFVRSCWQCSSSAMQPHKVSLTQTDLNTVYSYQRCSSSVRSAVQHYGIISTVWNCQKCSSHVRQPCTVSPKNPILFLMWWGIGVYEKWKVRKYHTHLTKVAIFGLNDSKDFQTIFLAPVMTNEVVSQWLQ